jgi:hypothetical protein
MQSEVPSQSSIWGVLAHRFQSDLTRRKSRIWRLSGLVAEYGGRADGNLYREREQGALIEALAGLLTLAVVHEVAKRQLANDSGRRVGRPGDVLIPFLAPELLSVFMRCHDKAGRQSAITSIDGKLKQKEDGQLFDFIELIIEPLNQYLTTELHRRPLSASRLARFALKDRRSMTQAQSKVKPLAKETVVAKKRQLLPFEIALREVFAISE